MKITIKELRQMIREELSYDEIGYSTSHPKYGRVVGNQAGDQWYHYTTTGKPTHDKPFIKMNDAVQRAIKLSKGK